LAAGPVKVFNTAPNAGGVGIWQSGGAVAADASGDLYFAVGNGFNGPNLAFDPAHGDYSESVLKLSATGQLSVADYFTPFDWQTLDNQDADLGSGGTMLLPDFVGSAAHPHLMVETGKSGKIYLIDRDAMGKFTAGGPDQVVQTVTAGQVGVWGNPSFLKINPTTGIIYYHGQGDYLKGYTITNAHIDDTTGHILKSNVFSGYPGTQPVVSANGIANPTNPTNAIVWELQVDSDTGPAVLRAFNATNLTSELYDSSQTSFRDLPGGAVKFTVPSVTNGHVLVAQQYTFSVFGLFPPATSVPAPPTNLQGTGQAGTQGPQIQLTWTNPVPMSGAAATGIKVFRSTDNANFSQIATVAASVATYTDQGPLMPGQHYFYEVVAANQVGDSAASNTVDVVAPIAASVLTITSVTSSSLGLNWTSVANDHYDIERSTNGGSFAKVASVPASETAYTDTGLAPGIYAYRIHAFSMNPAAESLSNVRGATVGGVVDHSNGFGNAVDLSANGNAIFAENAARLTGADLQTGSVFANTLLTITKFSTTFLVRLHEGTQPDYADGFAFVLQANTPTALGQGLGGLGYQGIANSVAIKFGTFQYPGDPSNSSTALVLNGAAPQGGVTTGNVLLNSQNPKQVDLTYDGTTLTETITDTLTSATFTTSYVVNIPQILGGDLAYVGFTGATGSPGPTSFWELQDIGSWTFTSQAPLPGEPTNLRVTATTASEIDLAWNGTSYNETGFRVERSTDLVNFTTVSTTTATTFADKGLAHGTYYYRVVAVNAAGSSVPSNVVGATVPPSDPPPVITGVTRSNFAVKPNGTFTLNVDFTDSDPNDPHTAVITWGDPSSPTTLSLAAGVVHFSASHAYQGAVSGMNFTIHVAIQDDDGGSDAVDLSATSASVAPPAGLVDWYTGDGYTPTTAADIAGTHPGTLVGGVTFVPGKVGNAFSFNGTDAYVKLPDNFLPYPTTGTSNAPLSFTAWFKTTAGGVILGQQGGPAFGNPSGWVPAVYVGTDGKLRVEMFWNGGVSQAVSPAAVNDGLLHFVSVSSDGHTEAVYLDNQLIGTISGTQVAYTTSYSYQIGTGYTAGDWQAVTGSWYSFRGLIDEVQFYNTAVPAANLQAIYNAGGAGQVEGVTALDLPPAVTSVSRSAFTINENGTFTLNGTLTDPQPGDPHTVTINWGDGAMNSTVTVPAGEVHFSATHTYLDEPASGIPYPIQVTVQDIALGSDTVILTSGAGAITPAANLVGWWTGDGNNPTTVPDVAGTNPGTVNGGVTYAPGMVGNALSFDGGNGSFVNVPDASSLDSSSGTWDFWVQTTQAGAYVGFVGKHDAVTSYNGITMYIDPSGLPSAQIKNASQTVTLTGATPINDGRFHHLALTFQSGGVTTLFVDGQPQATATAPAFSFNPNPLRFGRMFDPFWSPLKGLLDEMQIFDRVLSAAEIQAIVSAGGAGQVKSVSVADPAVVGTGGFTVHAVAGTASALQTVATFTDPGGSEALGDYSATINWGDGSSSRGTISGPDAGVFTVQGSHTYFIAGSHTLIITLSHDAAPDAAAMSMADVTPAAFSVLMVAGFPSPTTAGVAHNFRVTSQDAYGNTVTDYTGTAHFSSSDAQAQLPADFTFTPLDHSSRFFTAVLKTAGIQSLAATDVAAGVTGSQDGIGVTPAGAVTLQVMGFPSPVVAGTPGSFAVTVLDPFGNTVTSYTGTVHFRSSDPQAGLPDDYTFTADDQGTHAFSATLFTAGSRSLIAQDAAHFLGGTQDGIEVTPAAAVQFQVSAPAAASSGMPFDVTVTALDPYGNVDTNYTGTVTFATSDPDPGVVLPPNYTFRPADAGTVTFVGGVTLITPGDQTLTVTDTASGITGSATVTVTDGPQAPGGNISGSAAAAAPEMGYAINPVSNDAALDAALAAMAWENGPADRGFSWATPTRRDGAQRVGQ
jgi:hypothetical protein